MDKASASGAGDSRFESWAGHVYDMRISLHAERIAIANSCYAISCRSFLFWACPSRQRVLPVTPILQSIWYIPTFVFTSTT